MNGLNNELPKNWIWSSLGEIYNVIGGGTPSTENPKYWGGKTPWITSADINGVRSINIRKYVTEEGIKESTTNTVPEKTLLVVTRVGLGKIAISKAPICFSQDLQGLIQNPKLVIPEYTLYLLSYQLQFLKFDGRGTTISGLTKKQLKDLEFPLSPIEEQKRIVAKIEELFSELDQGVSNLKTAQAQLKVYRQALLKQAFEGKLTEQWRHDNQDQLESASDLQKRIQDERSQRYQQQLQAWEANGKQGGKPKAPKTLPSLSAEELFELPDLPNGWSYTKVGNLIDDPTYGTSKKCDYETDGIGVLRIPNVVSGKIDSSDLKFASFTEEEIATYKLNSGDILIIRSNGSVSIVGRCALIAKADVNYLYAGYLIRLRPLRNLIQSKYLLNAFLLHGTRKQIEKKAKSTSGVNNINTGEIQSLVIALCGTEEQEQIVLTLESKLSSIDQLELTITTALKQSEALRQSILKKAFSGQLVARDANDEPASVLLERIKIEKEIEAQASKKSLTKGVHHG